MQPSQQTFGFHQAAIRHYKDAELLREHQRMPNAGQLYGFSVECGIKALLIGHGYPTNQEGDMVEKKQPKFRRHIDVLAKNMNQLRTFLDGRDGARYLALTPNIDKFSSWSTDHRYYHESSIPHALDNWHSGAEEIMRVLDEAILDGRIS